MITQNIITSQETLLSLFKNSNFSTQYFDVKETSLDNTFCDITDGNSFKNNIFYKQNPHALQLILYQDAYEICNPLGASRKKHKIVGVYLTVANIHAWQRVKIDQINLVALMYEKDLKRLGASELFNIIIQDLRKIEQTGIEISYIEIRR